MKKVTQWSSLLPVLALLCSMQTVRAQGWSVSANVPEVGAVGAAIYLPTPPDVSDINFLQPGVRAPGTIETALASSSGYQSSATVSWAPSVPLQTAPIAFSVASVRAKQFPLVLPPGDTTFAGTFVNVVLDMTFTSPAPVDGALQLRVAGDDHTIGNFILVDVDIDGIDDWTFGTSVDGAMLPLSIPVGGVTIRVTYAMTGYYGGPGTLTTANELQAQFFPGTTICEPYDFTGASVLLGVVPQGNDVYDLVLEPVAATTPLLMVFGFQDYVVPLWPTVTVLVGLDVLVATGPSGTVQLAMPPLPSGYELFAQGLSIDAAGDLRSSNSVRALVL